MKADSSLALAFLASHPKDAARVVEQAGSRAGASVLARCSHRVIAETLRQMDPAEAGAVLACLPDDSARAVLSELPLGASALMLRQLDDGDRERLLGSAPQETARSLRTALFHSKGTAGSMMDSNVLALPSTVSAGEARQRIRRRSRQTGNYLYVVDEGRKPVGVVSLAELMLASPKATLASVMRSTVVRIPARARVDTILSHPGWRGLHALPVVDAEGVLVGVLRRETYERLREEADGGSGAGGTGLGLALAELFWTLTASAVDELGRAVRQPEKSHAE